MSDLTKLTVSLTPRSLAALEAAAERCGDSQTDTVNRALQIYDAVTKAFYGSGGRITINDVFGRVGVVEARPL